MVQERSISKWTRLLLLPLLVLWFSARPMQCTELKDETARAFDRYINISESRMQAELRGGPFLYIDGLPAARRSEAYALLRQGQILLRHENTKEEGHPLTVPYGLIHDWSGVAFIPGTSLSRTLAVVLDYDNLHNIYTDVHQSRLIARNGNIFTVFLQFYKKSLITVVLNAQFESYLEQFGVRRAVIWSRSTRIAEVEDPDDAGARELPVNSGHGYLWRLNSYWRFEERDGGVYVQLESIGLSRSVPAIFAWLVNPLLRSIPRGTLSGLLRETRTAVLQTNKQSPAQRTTDSPLAARPAVRKAHLLPATTRTPHPPPTR